MIKMTMQEWSDFTGCYTAVTTDPENIMQRLHFFVNKPVVANMEASTFLGWRDYKHYLVGTLAQDLFVHFDGDWKDSLCTPSDKKTKE